MTHLKLKKLTLACGMALGTLGVANVASAAAVDVFLSGSTALDPNLQIAVAQMCDTTLAANKYSSTAGSAWVCTAKSGLSFVATGDVLTIRKEVVGGGSGAGIGPVVAGSTTLLSKPGTTGCSTTTGTLTVSGVTFTTNTGCAAIASQVPTAGISDVEPRLFGVTSGLSSAGIVGVVFGVAASDKLYAKLQGLQGLTPGDFSEAQAPTLKSAELRAIMLGKIKDWTLIKGTVPGTITATGSGTTAVKLCRRGPTSGTQKSFEVRMLGLGCGGDFAAGSTALLGPVNNLNDDSEDNDAALFDTGATAGGGGYRGYTGVYTMVINNGSGQVDQCLTDADNQDELAIGYLGVDRLSGAGGSAGDDADGAIDKWHYVKLDNSYPSAANVVSGSYDNLWTVSTLNRRTSGYLSQETAVMNEIGKLMGNPATLGPGVVALPSSYTWDGVQPIARAERRLGTVINNCQETLVQ